VRPDVRPQCAAASRDGGGQRVVGRADLCIATGPLPRRRWEMRVEQPSSADTGVAAVGRVDPDSAGVAAYWGSRCVPPPAGRNPTAPAQAWRVLRERGVAWKVSECCFEMAAAWLRLHFPGVISDGAAHLKRSATTTVAACDGLVLKATGPAGGVRRLKFALRPSSSRRSARLASELRRAGIATPEPVAWATVRRAGLRQRDYLVTVHVRDAVILTHVLRRAGLPGDQRRDVVRMLGELLAAFHANRYSNRDMKDANLLVAEGGGTPQLWVVDMDGVRRVRRLTRRQVLRDFWSVVRSLRKNGWDEVECKRWLVEAYNARVPERLRFEALPDRFPDWAA
jgi:tRNA A-37 threonylcarbamoyl transferase component Bud32